MLVIPLWPSIAHNHRTSPTAVRQLTLLKTDFSREVLTADGLELGLGSTAWHSEAFQTSLKLHHIPSESDSRINIIIPTGLAVASSQSLTGLVSSSGRAKGQSSEIN